MKSWIPFYKKTIDSVTNTRINKYYSNKRSQKFPFQVSDDLYIRNYNDTIFNEIINSELSDSLSYVYSDLPYFLLKFYLEKNINYLWIPKSKNTFMIKLDQHH